MQNLSLDKTILLIEQNIMRLTKTHNETLDELNKSLKYFNKLKSHIEQNKPVLETKHTDIELWKDIEVYGIKFNYQISNHGKVKNKHTNQILSQSLRDGYKSVCMSYNDNNISKVKYIKVHRIVALMFIPNDDPINKNVANHIDGDKFNNHYTNFEWVTIGQNNQHAIDTGLTKITKRRVTKCDLDGIEIETFESLDAAKKTTNIDDGGIAKVCKGTRNSAGGFKWKYTDENPNEQNLCEEELEGFIQVKDFPNYLIDRAGRVYSKPYKKFLKTVKTRDNSQELQLANNGIRKTYLLHNLMAEHFLDSIDGKHEVGHINRNKSDNRVTNLKRVNHSELIAMAKQNQVQYINV